MQEISFSAGSSRCQRIPWDQFARAICSLEYGLNNQIWRMPGAGKAYLVQVARLDALCEDTWSSEAVRHG